MRKDRVLAIAVAILAFGLAAPHPAKAFDFFGEPYRVGSSTDPYAYQPSLPGYYPYVNSGQWRPIEEMRRTSRHRYELPKYSQAWGWNSREWALANRRDHRWLLNR